MVSSPTYAPEKRSFALKTDFSLLGDLEGDLTRVEELNSILNRTDSSHALAAGFKVRLGSQSGWSGVRVGRNGSGCGSATVKVACRISSNGRSDIRNISRSSSSISRGTSKNSRRISSGTSTISDRSRNSSTSSTSRGTSPSSPHSIRGIGSITRLFHVWSAGALPVRVPRSTPYTEHTSSGPMRGSASCYLIRILKIPPTLVADHLPLTLPGIHYTCIWHG